MQYNNSCTARNYILWSEMIKRTPMMY